MTKKLLTLENIRSSAVPSDAHAVGFLLGEIEQLQMRLKRHEPVSLYNGHDIDWWKAEAERLREVLTIPNITPDTTSSALFIRTLSEHEKGQPVNGQDLINALMWRVKNQRKEIARLHEKRSDEPGEQLPADERLAKATQALEYISEYCHGTEAHGIARSALVDIADLNAQRASLSTPAGGCTCMGCPVHGIPKYMTEGASRDASPADLVGALQDVVHTDTGPVRVGKAHRDASSDGTCPVCGFPKGHCHIGCTAPPPAPPGVHYHTFKYIGNSPQSGNQIYQCETCGYRILETNAQRTFEQRSGEE